MTDYGKTKAYKGGLAIVCRCGLVFSFAGFRQRYNDHTWECPEVDASQLFGDKNG